MGYYLLMNHFSIKRQFKNTSFIVTEFTDKTDYYEKVYAFYY
ncbi:hypothetical protein DDD_0143 [Nonlabens dokdonensis DSW-6]|uniref:Uncharacterized protein n=1 Tax=Nonlabens dokdonensis (strain DSM 17205 / KCTC 12402 / DSW-6) TaxID=592029 RepID=L7W1B3_NONDD|nr:hypothetical protein DDD_0143 [Nonlabens dokdonensis DSW-6]